MWDEFDEVMITTMLNISMSHKSVSHQTSHYSIRIAFWKITLNRLLNHLKPYTHFPEIRARPAEPNNYILIQRFSCTRALLVWFWNRSMPTSQKNLSSDSRNLLLSSATSLLFAAWLLKVAHRQDVSILHRTMVLLSDSYFACIRLL